MAGGKGGSTTTSVQVPEYIEEAAKRNLARADTISQIGYVPYYGPDVAAFTPTQEAAFQNVASQAGAFGLTTPAGGPMAGMPAPQQFAGGIQGYSSAPMYEQALGELATRRPAQFNLIESLFINPVTGQVGANVGSPVAPVIDATAPMIDTTSPVISGVGGGGIGTLPSVTGDPIADLGIQPNPEIYNAYPEQVQDDIVTLATDPTNIDYDVAFTNVYGYQSEQAESDPYGMSTGVGITPEILEAAGGAESFLPPTQDDFSQSFDRDSSPTPVLRPTQAEDTFGADLYRSLTDPTYDPEGTVLSRALGGLLGDTTSSQPTKLETLGDYLQAAPSMGMTATEAAIAYEQNKPQSKGQESSEREALATRDRGEFSAAVEIAKDPEKYKELAKKDPRQAVKDLGLPAYDKDTSREILNKLAREAELTVAVAEDLDKYKTLAKKNPKQALADLGMTGYDREHASEVLRQVIRRVEA